MTLAPGRDREAERQNLFVGRPDGSESGNSDENFCSERQNLDQSHGRIQPFVRF